MEPTRPSFWPRHLEYPALTMFQMVERIAQAYPDEPAYSFYGRRISYHRFLHRIERAAGALWAQGIRPGDVVTLCMPNVPQALDCFYAVNRIGAVANMVHPLSAETEIAFTLQKTGSRLLITLDLFYEKAVAATEALPFPVTLVIARIQDELPLPQAAAYVLLKGRSFLRFPKAPHLLYSRFLRNAAAPEGLPAPACVPDRTAVILYSGGTTGTPKGIRLSDLNFNACAMQARAAIDEEFRTGLTMLSCMPLFHGFGLGINLHTVLIHGACCVLMPTFNARSYAKMLLKVKPNFIAGVPTIFEALLHLPELEKADLSFLMGMFCGGDSLSPELKDRIDAFLQQHNAHIQVREGYGLTECVTASCLTPKHAHRRGSIGLPFPDTEYAIVRPGTTERLPAGAEGEIILRGPTLMQGYLDEPEETAAALRTLPDGYTWLYTGDLGCMDEDGYVYFRQRLKRMIVTNGYNVYPSQIENALDACPEVAYSCVIGVPDPRRMQRVRAYVVLREGVPATDATRASLLSQLKKTVAAYAMPREIEFRDSLPRTLVGKVAYRTLEEEVSA